MNNPSHHGVDQFDLTGHIGPMFPEITQNAEWPMYSFDRPAMLLWQAIGKKLAEGGFRNDEIKAWLQSKGPRYALDGCLGENIARLGEHYAAEMLAGRQS